MLKRALLPLPFFWRALRYRFRVEPREIRYVIDSLRPGDCAVDIGAHRGGYVYWMRRAVGPTGRVLAFEPQPELASYLRAMIARLGMKEVTLEELAVSDLPGSAILQVPEGGPACGASLEPGLVRGPSHAQPVSTCTLDSYLEKNPTLRVRLIKCDAEGHELRIFRGAARVLREHRPRLVFECEARHHLRDSVQAVFDHLSGLDYCGHYFHRGALREIAEFIPQLNGDPVLRKEYVNNFIFHPHEEEGFPGRSCRC